MEDQQQAYEVFREVVAYNFDCLLRRSQAFGPSDPANYSVMVNAAKFTGSQVHEVIKLADTHKLDCSVKVFGGTPYMVLA